MDFHNQKVDIQDQPILCMDQDKFYMCDVVGMWNGVNCVYSFYDEDEDDIVFSYVKVRGAGVAAGDASSDGDAATTA